MAGTYQTTLLYITHETEGGDHVLFEKALVRPADKDKVNAFNCPQCNKKLSVKLKKGSPTAGINPEKFQAAGRSLLRAGIGFVLVGIFCFLAAMVLLLLSQDALALMVGIVGGGMSAALGVSLLLACVFIKFALKQQQKSAGETWVETVDDWSGHRVKDGI